MVRRAAPRLVVALITSIVVAGAAVRAQQSGLSAAEKQRRWDLENQLEQIAVIERKVMMPMPDGVRLATDIYRPKNAGKVPIIFVRTPYNFNFWDVNNGVPADMSAQVEAVNRGYAYVVQNERGHFFSEGNYDILGSRQDGYNAIDSLTRQSWSNGRLGTTGCSSTAEWQMGVAALGHRGFSAMNVQGFGAGVGRVGPYYEQGNWYRGGAVQMLFIAWLYGEQNQVRPMFPPNTSREDLIRASKSFDLAQRPPPVNWSTALWHLPVQDLLKSVDAPHGIFADAMPVETGGRMIQRTPNDPAWYRGGLYHDDMKLNVPGMWFMSWYDVSIGPNLELFNHVRKSASPEIANQQWAVIAPVAHCSYTRATADTIVGERSMGDARLDYSAIVFGFFDRFLKGEQSPRLDALPRVTYYTMGMNKWQTSDTWPPAGAQPLTFYLTSGGRANSIAGDGSLAMAPPDTDRADAFTYVRSAAHGSPAGCPGLYVRAVQGRNRAVRSDHADLVRLL
jgi:putative CocE/NonD family hydrolase